MKSYLTVESETTAEIIVKRSRFIAVVAPVSDASEAEKLLSELKNRYSAATHVCYAYIADEQGNVKRFSDNGEPQGTAGLPILSALEGRGLKKCLAAVIRYFGGVKLGANGLVGAYSQAVAAALEKCAIIRMTYCRVFEIKVGFSDAEAVKKAKSLKVVETEYGDSVKLTAVAPDDFDSEKHVIGITSGRAEITPVGDGWYPL